MEWISSYIFGTGGREESVEPARSSSSAPKLPGLPADDSLNRSSDDETDGGTLSASDLSFDFMDFDEPEVKPPTPAPADASAKQWIYSKYTPIFEFAQSDFARIHNYASPLTVRFYPHGDSVKVQVGVYDNVEPSEVRECYLHQRLSVRNLLLVLDGLNADTVYYFECAMKEALPIIFSKPQAVVRCVLWTDKWDLVGELSSVFSEHCRHLVELNIGAQRSFAVPLPHPPTPFEAEAESVHRLMENWLPALADTLRCLRLYTCIAVSEDFARLVNDCVRLSHLTLSKLDELRSTPQFERITTFELNKQSLGYTNDDLVLCKRIYVYFPSATKFSLVGCNYNPLVECVLKRLAECQGQTYEVFQQCMKLGLIARALEVKYVVERTNPSNSADPKSVILWNKRFDSRVLLHRGDSTFMSRRSDSSDDSF